jgi:hypothetical protein
MSQALHFGKVVGHGQRFGDGFGFGNITYAFHDKFERLRENAKFHL